MYADCSDFRSDSVWMSSRPWRFGSPAASAFLLPGGWGPLWDGVKGGCGCGGEWKFAVWGRVPQWASGGGRRSFFSRRRSFPVRLSRHGPSLPVPRYALRATRHARRIHPKAAPGPSRPEGPYRGALLLSPFLGRQQKVSMSDFSNLFYESFRLKQGPSMPGSRPDGFRPSTRPARPWSRCSARPRRPPSSSPPLPAGR